MTSFKEEGEQDIFIRNLTFFRADLKKAISYKFLTVRQWPGRPGFNLRSSHTKDSKNGT